jgi:lincosamide nucleotidyltransferase A/C/D/E
MEADEVLEVLSWFDAWGLPVWIGGGWGVDALVGRQTRDHQDLDLMFGRDHEPNVVALLRARGFTEILDWRPGRFVMSAPGRELDLHPLELSPDGSAILRTNDGRRFDYPAGSLTTGTVGNREVPCITAELQWEFHQGYEPAEKDLHDLALLEELLGP